MKVGVFDSGLGGLTVVDAITQTFKGAEIFYIADTQYAPYGEKTHEQILKHSLDIARYLIESHSIDALIVACNTATSAAIKKLREVFPELIVIGTEPGIKPAIAMTNSGNVGVLATPATLKGEKYQQLVDKLASQKEVRVFEQACPGLVEQIELGHIDANKTIKMLKNWLEPMRKNAVDTIVLGCTHYPLVENSIKKIMGSDTRIVQTGIAIAKRLEDLSLKKGHQNLGTLQINIYSTGEINIDMINSILKTWEYGGKIVLRSEV